MPLAFVNAGTHPYYEPPAGLTGAEWVVARVLAGRGDDFRVALNAALDDQVVAHAEVIGGKWRVRCPADGCSSSQYADPADRRFWCVECCMDQFSNRWVAVVWPEDPETIEAVLAARPFSRNRNWIYGETLDELVAENRHHDLPDEHPEPGRAPTLADIAPGLVR
jgi:hypothetical protein